MPCSALLQKDVLQLVMKLCPSKMKIAYQKRHRTHLTQSLKLSSTAHCKVTLVYTGDQGLRGCYSHCHCSVLRKDHDTRSPGKDPNSKPDFHGLCIVFMHINKNKNPIRPNHRGSLVFPIILDCWYVKGSAQR